MHEEKFPLTADIQVHFPEARIVRIWTGAKLYAAEYEGKFCLIMDDGSLYEQLVDSNQPIVHNAVKLFEFDSENEREIYLNRTYPYSVLTDPNFSFEERMAAWQTELAKQVKAKRKPRYCEG